MMTKEPSSTGVHCTFNTTKTNDATPLNPSVGIVEAVNRGKHTEEMELAEVPGTVANKKKKELGVSNKFPKQFCFDLIDFDKWFLFYN